MIVSVAKGYVFVVFSVFARLIDSGLVSPLTIEKFTIEIQPFCPATHAANVEVGPFARIVRWPVVWFARGVELLKGRVAGALRLVVVRSSARGVGLFGPGFCWQCSLW